MMRSALDPQDRLSPFLLFFRVSCLQVQQLRQRRFGILPQNGVVCNIRIGMEFTSIEAGKL
ncbi:conserved hypothetical protein [delta proteobacterium NaphS2]|nr:conserved hypothetical protein [delta proteobacterium NaphS2]